jgi:omega-6 fatty acid desaturase (delta-12 desaturase)
LSKFFSITIRSFIYVRMFVIMHDAGHESFIRNKLGNDIIGTLMASFLLGDYFDWKKRHNLHHQITNNVNYAQPGQSAPINVSHFIKFGKWGRRLYLLVFSPFGMVFLVPTLYRILNLMTILKKVCRI